MCGLFESWVGKRLWSFFRFLVHIRRVLCKRVLLNCIESCWSLVGISIQNGCYSPYKLFHLNWGFLLGPLPLGKQGKADLEFSWTWPRSHHHPLHRLKPHWVPCWAWAGGWGCGPSAAWVKTHPGDGWTRTLNPPPSGSFQVPDFIKSLINVLVTVTPVPPEGRVGGFEEDRKLTLCCPSWRQGLAATPVAFHSLTHSLASIPRALL